MDPMREELLRICLRAARDLAGYYIANRPDPAHEELIQIGLRAGRDTTSLLIARYTEGVINRPFAGTVFDATVVLVRFGYTLYQAWTKKNEENNGGEGVEDIN